METEKKSYILEAKEGKYSELVKMLKEKDQMRFCFDEINTATTKEIGKSSLDEILSSGLVKDFRETHALELH